MEIIKKYWYILVLLIALVISFCFYIKTKEPQQKENTELKASKEIEEYAIDYFNKFVTVSNVNTYEVTIKMLKDAADQSLASYDKASLEKCHDESSMKFELEPGETNYKSYKNEFLCEK